MQTMSLKQKSKLHYDVYILSLNSYFISKVHINFVPNFLFGLSLSNVLEKGKEVL